MTAGRRLLLLRHAEAVASAAEASDALDHERPLSARGRRDAAALGAVLNSRGLMPELALVSTSRRTCETFELLRAAPSHPPAAPDPQGGTRRQLMEAMYLASAGTLLALLREQEAALGGLLLIGHNPGLHALALELAGGGGGPLLAERFPTCTLALFEVAGDWSGLDASHASLRDILRP